MRTVAVYSEADADLPQVELADEAVLLGESQAAKSYLNADRILEVARDRRVAAVHPGYGFLSENAVFAQQVAKAGLVWVGPPPEAIAAMGDKIAARNRMAAAGVPVSAGTGDPLSTVEAAVSAASSIGYPLMVKAAAGGGGIGMALAEDERALRTAFESARSRAERFFGSPAILLERYLTRARHVEVQILGLSDGTVIAVGERDCSVQRRHQKVAEEAPCPALDLNTRTELCNAAVRAGYEVGYRGAGTVEFLFDVDARRFVFLEMNTRLQVEHPITELVHDVDLVEAQLRIAAGEPTPGFDPTTLRPVGHAIELRVYAEDPKRFLPRPGRITRWRVPEVAGVRVDAGYREGNMVTPFYDPLLAKLCVWGEDRPEVLARARQAVGEFDLDGVVTNLPFFTELLDDPAYVAGDYDTHIIDRMRGKHASSVRS